MYCIYVRGPLAGSIFIVEAHTRYEDTEYVILRLTADQKKLISEAHFDCGHNGGINPHEIILYQRTPESIKNADYGGDGAWFHLRNPLEICPDTNKQAVQFLFK